LQQITPGDEAKIGAKLSVGPIGNLTLPLLTTRGVLGQDVSRALTAEAVKSPGRGLYRCWRCFRLSWAWGNQTRSAGFPLANSRYLRQRSTAWAGSPRS
jgi:hypothetical protein